MTKLVKTLCPYCGVGCSLYLKVENERVVGVLPDKKDPISEGKPCIKGLCSHQSIYVDRVKEPMIRINGAMKTVTWNEAYEYIYKKTHKLNSHEIAFYGSSPGTNEDNYLLQKFARDIFRTNNIDSCARICHAATCYAFNYAFGMTAMPARINDFKNADCILIIGSNPKVAYPVAFDKIMKAKKKGKLICIRYWKDETSQNADLFVEIEDGTETAILNCILNYLKVKLPGDVRDVVKRYTIKYASYVCKADATKIKKAIALIKKSKRFVLGFGMGMTQHRYGVDNVSAAINLVLAKKGKIISMRGKANIQGVGDMGCLPREGGDTIISSIFFDPVKALYIMESSPAQSLPDLNKAHKALKEMFIVQQITYPNSTMEFADVVLPACSWAERDGTYTNAESRIRYLNKAIEPLHYSKPHWQIIDELAKYFGKNYNYKSSKDILKEIKRVVPGYEILDLKKLKDKGQFVKRKARFKKFRAVEFQGVEGRTSKEFPFVLTTERVMYHFCTGEMSTRSETLKRLMPEALCHVSKEDASRLKLKDGDKIRLRSKAGKVEIKIKIGDNVPKGLLIAPFHFENVLINKLFPLEIGLVEEANLKRVAVNIEKI